MLAIQCQFCRRENQPGSRFCAECGSPLHLKPCPKCGKVDDIMARSCYACGTAFEPIATAEMAPSASSASSVAPSSAAPGDAAPNSPRVDVPTSSRGETEMPTQPPATDSKGAGDAAKPHTSPWPLIVIAVLAGGLPLLWMNRANLPLPQAWRIGESGIRPGSGVEVRTPTSPLVLPPPTGSAVKAPEAAPPPPAVQPAPQPAPQPTPAAAPAPAAKPAATEQAAPAEPAQTEPRRAKASGEASRTRTAKASSRRSTERTAEAGAAPARSRNETAAASDAAPAAQPPAAETAPPRECTEAVAALGLCDPKRVKK